MTVIGFLMFSCGLLVRVYLTEHKYDRIVPAVGVFGLQLLKVQKARSQFDKYAEQLMGQMLLQL